jgi:hypothetical protein
MCYWRVKKAKKKVSILTHAESYREVLDDTKQKKWK